MQSQGEKPINRDEKIKAINAAIRKADRKTRDTTLRYCVAVGDDETVDLVYTFLLQLL